MIKKLTHLSVIFMKLSVLAIICSFTFAGLAFAKNASGQITGTLVTITLNNEPLKDAIQEIEQKTHIRFSFNSKDLDKYNIEGGNYLNESLNDLLAAFLRNTPLKYKEINNEIVIYKLRNESCATADDKNTLSKVIADITVKGNVSDETGPLIGVSVKVEGATAAAITDANGNYSISAPGSAVLVFSYIGYKPQRVSINNQQVINVKLIPQPHSLADVIVVGYGVQKKSDVTGSITSVTSQALEDVPSSNLVTALQGQGTGIDIQKSGGNSHPGSIPSITIRGTRSKSASNSPLFVVDGIPYTGSLQDLNMDDVASVEVLKDASSTAIYGSRGANGVILVTTRHGRAGEPIVTYSGYAGIEKVLAQYDVMNGPQYEELKKWAYFNAAAANPLYTSPDDPRILTSGAFGSQELTSIKTGRSTNWQDLIY
ncbi:MAG: TonB-dependent receptor plug domain-containing protein, partial [Mucilaginibacter sp.]